MQDFQLVYSGDEYFDKLWDAIDNSKKCCWIVTYHMKKSFIADETLRRLAGAAKRGVDVVLYVDWLNYYLDQSLIVKLQKAGGRVECLNSMSLKTRFFSAIAIFTKYIFKRHHEKVSLIDDTLVIGSSNFDIEYGGVKYGNNKFCDLSVFIKNRCIVQSQDFFRNIAKTYGYELEPHLIHDIEDKSLSLEVSEPLHFRHDIQELLLRKINEAKTRVIIAQGYFFHIKKVHKALKRASERGVEIRLITTKERDQPVYKDLVNTKLAKKLMAIGGKVSETTGKIFHAKTYIIDDHLIMGSFNNDKWSWSMNSEVVLSCSNKAITDQAFKIIENFKKDTQDVKMGLVQVIKSSTSGFWKWFLRTSEHVMNTKKNNKYFILHSYVDDDSNPIEERYAMRMKRIENFKINTSTLSMITYI